MICWGADTAVTAGDGGESDRGMDGEDDIGRGDDEIGDMLPGVAYALDILCVSWNDSSTSKKSSEDTEDDTEDRRNDKGGDTGGDNVDSTNASAVEPMPYFSNAVSLSMLHT